MEQILAIVTGINLFHLIASAVAQQVFTMAWFGGIVSYMENYYLAADKGVRRVEHVVQRHAAFACSAVAFACALLRTVAIAVLVSLLRAKTLVEYQQLAIVVAVVGLTRVHRSFSRQRPLQLIVVDTAHEVAAALVGAMTFYAVEKYKF